MGRFTEFGFQSQQGSYTTAVVSDSNVTGFAFESDGKSSKISFDVKGSTGEQSFCRITVPSDFMN